MTKKYSPDSWDLLMRYENLPAKLEAEAVNGGIATTKKSVSTFNYLKGERGSIFFHQWQPMYTRLPTDIAI